MSESVVARVDAKTRRVDRWRTSDEKQRWCAATLLHMEDNYGRVKRYKHLALLQRALMPKMMLTSSAAA